MKEFTVERFGIVRLRCNRCADTVRTEAEGETHLREKHSFVLMTSQAATA